MSITEFKNELDHSPESIAFTDTMALIEANYTFTPTAFTNGTVKNKSGKNSGSCKLFAFARKEGLTKEQTLACFGQFYKDVLNTPEGTDHQNIRNFMKTGFEGLVFIGDALNKI